MTKDTGMEATRGSITQTSLTQADLASIMTDNPNFNSKDP
jgi:hypothetical protein